MSSRAVPPVLARPIDPAARIPAIGRTVLVVLAITLIAMVVVAVRYLLFEYAHGGESIVLRLLQFFSP